MEPWKFTLADYVRRHAAAAWHERGVVPPGEQSTPWPLFISADEESMVDAMTTRARNTYKPFVALDRDTASASERNSGKEG